MYYKIENKESDVYKKLHAMRTKELQISKDNIKSINEKTGLEWDNYLGKTGQQNFRRVTMYSGFEFKEPEKVDLKIWKKHDEYPTIFIPNNRTKKGREMRDFLTNGLEGSIYDKPLEILKLPRLRRFTFPYVEIEGDVIVIFLGEGHEPKDPNLIEITQREFKELSIEVDCL